MVSFYEYKIKFTESIINFSYYKKYYPCSIDYINQILFFIFFISTYFARNFGVYFFFAR